MKFLNFLSEQVKKNGNKIQLIVKYQNVKNQREILIFHADIKEQFLKQKSNITGGRI